MKTNTSQFIAIVDTFNTASGKKIETLHWLIEAHTPADRTVAERVKNTNRTIPAILNKIVGTVRFDPEICVFLKRGITCQGHPAMTALKQERGGNEGVQL